MRRSITAVLFSLGVLSLAGCDKLSQLTKSGSSSSGSGASSSPSSSYSSSGSIGVAECDDYIRVYKECLADKVPEADRAQLQSALDQNVDYWRQTALNPDAKAGLAATCKEARDTTGNSLGAYGCSF